MNRYNPLAVTIRIITHKANRSTMVINALLNRAGATADIILIQEVNITNPKYEVTHRDFILIKPP
jgi:hypothetical protein